MKISVVIPSRSRAAYLSKTLESVRVAIERCPVPVEVVVSDNASEDRTPEVCAGAGVSTLVYTRQARRLSMRQNFEAALDMASGSHIVFIGDDDAVTPHGLARLSEMIETSGCEIIKWRLANYVWQDLHRGVPASIVLRTWKLSNLVRRIDPKKRLRRFLDASYGSYQSGGILYHGCISRELIERVRSRQGGTYFWSASPDVFVAVANLLHTKTDMLMVDAPITIGGASPRSNGMSSSRYMTTGNLAEGSEFSQFIRESQSDPHLGQLSASCSSLALCVLDAVLLAHRLCGHDAAVKPEAWARCVSAEARNQAPRVALQTRSQAELLLGPHASLIQLPRVMDPEPNDRAADAPVETSSYIRISLGKVHLQGMPLIEDVATTAALVDHLSAMNRPFSSFPRGLVGALYEIRALRKRARVLLAHPA